MTDKFNLPSELNGFSDRVEEKINNEFSYPDKASGWGVDFDGRLLLHIERDEKFNKNIYLLIDIYDGELRKITPSWDEPKEYGFAYRGSYSDWKKLILSNSTESLRDGTFKLEGDLEIFLKYKDMNHLMVKSVQRINTEFEY